MLEKCACFGNRQTGTPTPFQSHPQTFSLLFAANCHCYRYAELFTGYDFYGGCFEVQVNTSWQAIPSYAARQVSRSGAGAGTEANGCGCPTRSTATAWTSPPAVGSRTWVSWTTR
ncbi:hypothetical protein GCM10010176_102090 [Nonomuraea spiralis]|nr:hypothetical protein GCM10010176_102090 [Nonomuraea spiralis]